MANASFELTPAQRQHAHQLAMIMKGVTAVLFLLGALLTVGGIAVLFTASASGLLMFVEGLVTILMGFIMLKSSTDVGFMVETNYAAAHLAHALQNLTVFYQFQFSLALFLVTVGVLQLIGQLLF